MAIVKMNKFTLFTFESCREILLKELQKLEAVHFRNLQVIESDETGELSKVSVSEKQSAAEAELSKVNFALSKIEPYYEKPKGLKAMAAPSPELGFEEFDSFTQNYDYDAVYSAVKENDELRKALKSEKSKLLTDNASLTSWLRLDVSTKELDSFKSVSSLLGTVPRQLAEGFIESVSHRFPDTYAELLDAVKEETGILIITLSENLEEVASTAKSHGFTKASLALDASPADIIAANNVRVAQIEKEEARLEAEISSQSSHYGNLRIAADCFKTLSERYKASENFLGTKSVCVAEGWFAENDAKIFEDAVSGICRGDYYLETAPVEKESEEVPIKLKNNKFVEAFEGVTEMYSMPKYNEIDPTPLLAPFYLVFFAMMLGDTGYGLVLTVATAVSLKFFNLSKSMRRFFRFFLYLGIATMAAGAVYGSFFGLTFFTVVNGKPILDLTNEIMLMLILSVAIGVIQIMFGLGIKGYMLLRDGKVLDAIFDVLFWMLAVGSLVALLALFGLGADMAFIKIAGVVLGVSLVGLGCTQGRSSPSIGGKIGNGIYSVYNITGYVGDFVSYTRLMALALAGAYIAFSFNLMGSLITADGTRNFIFYIPAALVVVFGAALNIGLSALGSYVHTCRLQYVEYFGKFYEGGGVPFKAFGFKNTFINIKK